MTLLPAGMKNIHTHTALCRHASGVPADYAEAAFSLGYALLGFSDHAPYRFPEGYYSGFRMYPGDMPSYISAVNRLKEEYKGKMEIRLGFETEYYPDCFGETLDFLRGAGAEYLILGQHATNNEYDGVSPSAPCADRAALESYTDQVIEGLETGAFCCLAHPDLFNYTGDSEHRYAALLRLLRTAERLHIPAEINLLGLSEGRHYPSVPLFRALADSGCETVFGVDAHKPTALNCGDVYKCAIEIVKKYHLNYRPDPLG